MKIPFGINFPKLKFGRPSFGFNKKILILIIFIPLIVIAGAAAVPYYAGLKVEEAYEKYLDLYRKDGQVKIESASFNRGWLSSTAEEVVSFSLMPNVKVRIAVSDKIEHGPNMLKGFLKGGREIKADVSGGATYKVLMGGVPFFSLPKMEYQFSIGMEGNAEGTFKVAPYSSPQGSPMEVRWSGLTGNMEIDMVPKTMKITMVSSPLTVNSPEGKISVGNAKADMDLREGPSELMVGRQAITVSKVEFLKDEGPFVLEGLKFTGTSSAAGDNINFTVNERVEKVTLGAATYGPGSLELQVRKLDAATMSEISKLLVEINKAEPKDGTPWPDAAGRLPGLLMKLTKKAPRIELTKLSFDTGDGIIDGSLSLVIDGSKVNIAENPMLLVGALDMEAHLQVPEHVARKVVATDDGKSPDERLKALVEKKFLVKENGGYKTDLTFKEGQLVLNGMPMDDVLPMLMMQGAALASGGGVREMGPPQVVTSIDKENSAEVADEKSTEVKVIPVEEELDRKWVELEQEKPPRPSAAKRHLRLSYRAYDYDTEMDIRTLTDRSKPWIDRNEAARRLGDRKDRSAVGVLIGALEGDPDHFVRREAAQSLGKIGDRRAIVPLRKALSDRNEWVRKFAREALDKFD